MRVKSAKVNGYTIYAISGTNTVSFAIDFRDAALKGLLGFSVERINHSTGERKFLDGYKVFTDIITNPNENTVANTYSHPVQSFVWDDFACYEGTTYEYFFYPLKGSPKNLDRSLKPIVLTIKTEDLFTNGEHDIFFNRGVASSQAYRRRFFNLPPDKMTNPEMKKSALSWLSRHLDEAILKFIDNAKKGETLLGCFYEFHYEPVVKAFADALKRGVIVKLIVDGKDNGSKDAAGKVKESFPREANLRAMKAAKIPTAKSKKILFLREAKSSSIQHNKFMLIIDKNNVAKEVWTGSTNISMGGIHGQTNVGHWIRNTKTAKQYQEYWEILSKDPGGHKGDERAITIEKNKELKQQVESLQEDIVFNDWADIPEGITSVFSPRSGLEMLETYVKMFDNSEDVGCVTLAFGINELFKNYLKDNTYSDHISFMLLEKEDKPNPKSKNEFSYINASQNVYKAHGSYINDTVYNWARETSTIGLKLNRHVAYIHSKFLLVDPLSADPVVISGSANFSAASTNDNDENMMIIRGNLRVADIYFTEFNRLFNHYYFRSVYNQTKKNNTSDSSSLILKPDDSWLKKYKSGLLRYKRVMMFTKMQGFS